MPMKKLRGKEAGKKFRPRFNESHYGGEGGPTSKFSIGDIVYDDVARREGEVFEIRQSSGGFQIGLRLVHNPRKYWFADERVPNPNEFKF
jgi:hypothetical protein